MTDNFTWFLFSVFTIGVFSVYCYASAIPKWPLLSFTLLTAAFFLFISVTSTTHAQETSIQLIDGDGNNLTFQQDDSRVWLEQISDKPAKEQFLIIHWSYTPTKHPASQNQQLCLYMQSKSGLETPLNQCGISASMILYYDDVDDAYYPFAGNYVYLRDGNGVVWAYTRFPERLKLWDTYFPFTVMIASAQPPALGQETARLSSLVCVEPRRRAVMSRLTQLFQVYRVDRPIQCASAHKTAFGRPLTPV